MMTAPAPSGVGAPGTSTTPLSAMLMRIALRVLPGVPGSVPAATVTWSRPAPLGTTCTLTFGRGAHRPGVGVGVAVAVGATLTVVLDDGRVDDEGLRLVVRAEPEPERVLAKLGVIVESERGRHLDALASNVLVGVRRALNQLAVADLDLDVAGFGQAGSAGAAIGDGDPSWIGAGLKGEVVLQVTVTRAVVRVDAWPDVGVADATIRRDGRDPLVLRAVEVVEDGVGEILANWRDVRVGADEFGGHDPARAVRRGCA